MPLSDLKECLEFFHEQVAIYPIWLCPFTLPNNPGMLKTPTGREEMFMDVGVYGVPKTKSYHALNTTRAVEEYVRQKKGSVWKKKC